MSNNKYKEKKKSYDIRIVSERENPTATFI